METLHHTVNREYRLAGRMTVALFVMIAGSLVNCQGKEAPPYVVTNSRLHSGSLFYAKNGCANCHGVDWNGEGPDAKDFVALGVKPTDFTAKIAADTTPVDYFKAISAPVEYFDARSQKAVNPVEYKKMMSTHAFQTLTDKARWNIANFLYSLATNAGENQQNVEQELADVKTIYHDRRRWEIGYQPIAERTPAHSLEEMTKGVALQSEMAMPNVSDQRKEAAFDSGTGAQLYYANCSSCHGNFAQGRVAGPRIGLLHNGPALENDKGFHRRPMAFVSIRDLKNSTALSSLGQFRAGHQNSDQIATSVENLTDEEWQELYTYTKRLTGL